MNEGLLSFVIIAFFFQNTMEYPRKNMRILRIFKK